MSQSWSGRFGAWLCRRGWHKYKPFISYDFAVKPRKSLVSTGRACERCPHIIFDKFNEDFKGTIDIQLENFQRDLLVVTDFAESQLTKVVQELTKNTEVKVVLKPYSTESAPGSRPPSISYDSLKLDMAIVDEVGDVPETIPEIPLIIPPGSIIPAQHLCPVCRVLLSPDVNIKNMYNCRVCRLAFGKFQLEALDRMELLPTRSAKQIVDDYRKARDNWGGDADLESDAIKLFEYESESAPGRELSKEEIEKGLGGLFGGEDE